MGSRDIRCPVCGSRNLKYGKTGMKGKNMTQEIHCEVCGCDWTHEFDG